MKLVIPKQHGAWAMLILPFLLGMLMGDATLLHIPLLIGWLFLYLATYPLIMVFTNKKGNNYKKWASIYLLLSSIFIVITLVYKFELIYFGLMMLPFFVVNLYYAKKKNERAFFNDVSAIIVFSLAGVGSYFVGVSELNVTALHLFIYSIFYFIGSTFFVKTMIREKNNVTFKWLSWGYHLLVPVIVVVFGNLYFLIAFLPSIIRAIVLYGKKVAIMKIGILEIFNSVFYFVIIALLYPY
ncbi:YwiC-like family protein [Bacillus timonensis]|nr:YwiC-like family protein [Bacillus timonensis]